MTMSYDIPQRLFLDTNIYIIGVANQNSYERKILEAVGFLHPSSVEVIVSEELLDQICGKLCFYSTIELMKIIQKL